MHRHALAPILVSLLLLAGVEASAQDGPPSTAVLSATASEDSLRGTAGAIERVVRARVEPLGVVRVAGTPALNLADLQLAVGCMGETPECLSTVAQSVEVEALLIPTVDRAGDEIVVGLTFFDRRGATRTERVVRRASGEQADAELVDGMDAMLRDLFGLPPPPPETHGGGGRAGGGGGDGGGGGGGFPVLPVVTLSVGVVAASIGVAFGLMSQSSEDEYAAAPVGTMADVDAALEIRDRAETQASIANVLMIAGGAVVVAGAVLLMLGGGSEEERPGASAWVAPIVTPSGTYLSVGGSFGENW